MIRANTPPGEICILRLSALGDVTHVVPVVNTIRQHWPDTRMTWIIGRLEHRLLDRLEGVEFIEFNKRGGWAAVKKLWSDLRGRRFDVLLHMQVAARANLLSRLVRAELRLGWDRARSRDRHHWFTNAAVASVTRQHQVEGFMEFARALGIEPGSPRWNFPVSEADRTWAQKKLGDGPPILMISPCSSHALRNWRPEYLARVAEHAMGELGMRVVLTGGPGELERRTGAEIETACRSPLMNLIGKDTLKQSIALLERADVLITPDSGPAHIASAVGTPVIGLHAATWSLRSGPWRSLDICVDRFAEAARRYRNREPEELRWGTRIEVPGVMDLIQTDDVIAALHRWSAAMTVGAQQGTESAPSAPE